MHIVIAAGCSCRGPADCLLLAASVDMIPLMMQKGYKAKGWLGLILGTRLYYTFHGAEVDDDAAFEKRMDALCREIGGRAMLRLPEAVPPPASRTQASVRSRAPAPAPARAAAPAPAPAPVPEPAPAPVPEERLKPKVTFETSLGSFVLELDPENAPLSTKNFLAYVNDGFYDGTIFHRVINGFMIQGGGFALVDGQGTQKETRNPIKNEAKNGLKNARGTISMARTNNPDSATSQFFINVVDNPGLDPRSPENPRGFSPDGYAVFGKVIEGMEVIDKIKQVNTGVRPLKVRGPGGDLREAPMQDVPLQNVVIKKATSS